MDGKIKRYLCKEFQNRKIERKRDKQRYRWIDRPILQSMKKHNSLS